MKTFKEQVISIIAAIPKAKVASYGQIAAYAGSPRAARQVGGILRGADDGALPWWRVINNAGLISIKGNWYATPQVQKELLQKEKVVVDKNFLIDMTRYRWTPSINQIEKILEDSV